MRHQTLALASAALLLAACGSTHPPGGYGGGDYRPPPPVTPAYNQAPLAPGARIVSYVCEDLTRITFTEGQPNARAMLNSGLELSLARTGANRYGAGSYDFRALGAEGQWFNSGKAWRCRIG
ncbi:MAG: hypothetical protein HY854_22580 [Burkholderiales bacterium]|nr:hypothetical protein [Burkholderiales bacterium]